MDPLGARNPNSHCSVYDLDLDTGRGEPRGRKDLFARRELTRASRCLKSEAFGVSCTEMGPAVVPLNPKP